jgi:hypothetical protein
VEAGKAVVGVVAVREAEAGKAVVGVVVVPEVEAGKAVVEVVAAVGEVVRGPVLAAPRLPNPSATLAMTRRRPRRIRLARSPISRT